MVWSLERVPLKESEAKRNFMLYLLLPFGNHYMIIFAAISDRTRPLPHDLSSIVHFHSSRLPSR